MAEITRERVGQLLRQVFAILLESDDGLPAKTVLERVAQSVSLTNFEKSSYPLRPNDRRFEKIIRFATISPVKAGWLVKDRGKWQVTEEGRIAFVKYQRPEEFAREAGRLYRRWRSNQRKSTRARTKGKGRSGRKLSQAHGATGSVIPRQRTERSTPSIPLDAWPVGERRVLPCVHCGNRAPHRLVYTYPYSDTVYDLEGEIFAESVEAAYYVLVCETCTDLALYHANGLSSVSFVDAEIVWPFMASLDDSVPEAIRKYYGDALVLKERHPDLFAVQIRKALEVLCEDKGVAKGNLGSRLKKLAELGQLPPTLAEMTEILRFFGNIGAHAGRKKVRLKHVRALDTFFRTVVEYVYVAPHRVRELNGELS